MKILANLKKFDVYSWGALVLAIFFGTMVFFGLGDRPFIDYDEGIYAQVAAEASNHPSPFGFTWLGNVGLGRTIQWYEKPPLMLWLIQISYKFFGVNEFAARLPTAGFAMATFLLVAWLARRISGIQWSGLMAAAVLGICYQYVHHASVLQFDIPVGFFIAMSLGSFVLALKNPNWWYGFWLGLALGVMTKSIIGLLPGIPLAIYLLSERQWQIFKEKKLYFGLLMFLILTVPWHLAEWGRFGHEFWDQYLFYHLISRFRIGLENNIGNKYFYWELIKQHRILVYLLIPAFVYSIWKSFWDRKWLIFPLSAVVVFGFFSIAKTKLPAYILPIYPLLSVIIAMAWSDIIKRLTNFSFAIQKAVFVLALGGLLFFSARFLNYDKQQVWQKYLLDSKEVGLFLRNLDDRPIYYYSTTGTRPAVIFYSGRVVHYLKYPSPKPAPSFYLLSEIDPGFENSQAIYKTGTQTVYLVQ